MIINKISPQIAGQNTSLLDIDSKVTRPNRFTRTVVQAGCDGYAVCHCFE